jgi:hypothetical protein
MVVHAEADPTESREPTPTETWRVGHLLAHAVISVAQRCRACAAYCACVPTYVAWRTTALPAVQVYCGTPQEYAALLHHDESGVVNTGRISCRAI